MARTSSYVKTSIWSDEFRALPSAAQHLYIAMWTSAGLSYAGVADWRPARLAKIAADLTPTSVVGAGLILHRELYIVVDEETEEVLIRSFIRNDGLMDQPNVAAAMVSDYAKIASPAIRGVIVHELQRLFEESPELKGWRDPKSGKERASTLLGNPSVDPSINPSGWGSPNPSDEELGTIRLTHAPLLTPNSLLPTPDSPPPLDTERDDVERLCQHLSDRIVDNGTVRPPITKRWRDAARLMLDKEGRTEDQIHAAIDWCQSDGFWKANILSMPKLREKYDQLRLAAQRNTFPAPAPKDGLFERAMERAAQQRLEIVQ